jgi:phenylacetate-CoA ligase
MIWNEAVEAMPRAQLEALQSQRLAELVARLYDRVPFYRQALDARGIRPGSIRGLADLDRLPCTRKSDLHEHYPLGLLAVARGELARIHASSGTGGKPTIVGYTRGDLETWAEVCARCLAAAGARPGQVFQNAYGYGLFTGGLGLHAGAERLGLTVVPASVGNTAQQITLMQDLGTEVLACTPSYALTIADAIEARGIDRHSLRLETLLLGAEPWTQSMRAAIESRLGANAINIYGLSEVIGPGVSIECVDVKHGSHVFEDHFLIEVLDPDSEEPVPDGHIGELVFTTLTKEALPLVRFRTGDLSAVTREPCRCGRTLARMMRIVGRTDDMLIIRGVNVYPSQIESVLLEFEELSPHYQLTVSRPARQDEFEVMVEIAHEACAEPVAIVTETTMGEIAASELARRVEGRLREMLGVHARVNCCTPGQLPRSDGGKLARVRDTRGLAEREAPDISQKAVHV